MKFEGEVHCQFIVRAKSSVLGPSKSSDIQIVLLLKVWALGLSDKHIFSPFGCAFISHVHD